MKTVKVIALFCVFAALMGGKTLAQADIIRGERWQSLPFRGPDGRIWGPYYSTETFIIVSPSGNITITLLFQMDINDPRVPEYGVNKMPSIAYYSHDGTSYQTLDGEKIITSDGKSTSVYHVNGQQEATLLKDDGCMDFYCTGENICGTTIKEIQFWNGNIHINLFASYLGESSGRQYSASGTCNARFEKSGQIIVIPITIKMGEQIVALIHKTYGVILDAGGNIDLDDDVPGTIGECR